jgi:hypothetical protein
LVKISVSMMLSAVDRWILGLLSFAAHPLLLTLLLLLRLLLLLCSDLELAYQLQQQAAEAAAAEAAAEEAEEASTPTDWAVLPPGGTVDGSLHELRVSCCCCCCCCCFGTKVFGMYVGFPAAAAAAAGCVAAVAFAAGCSSCRRDC